MKWDSETLELLMKYTKVFYNPTVTTPSQVDHKEKQSTKDAAMAEAAKVENPISQNSEILGFSNNPQFLSPVKKTAGLPEASSHTHIHEAHTK